MAPSQPRTGPGGRQDAPEGKQRPGQGRCRRKMRQCQGNRTAAARLLGIGRRTLYSKMEKLEISSRLPAAVAGGPAEVSDPDLLFP